MSAQEARWYAPNRIDGMSRRQFFAKAAAASTSGALLSLAGPVIEKAYGAGPCSGHLSDIEHFVLLMQENRSFDHYFGTLSGTNGFGSASPAFQQKGWNPQTQALDPNGITMPYRFDTTRGPTLGRRVRQRPEPQLDRHARVVEQRRQRQLAAGAGGEPLQGHTCRSRWATTRARTCRSTTCWPTRSPFATPTTAHCWGGPPPTGSTG